jgi:uncharacterized membrane protein YjjP (DUF1212 family)
MPEVSSDQRQLLQFLARLGQAELAAGNAVALIERDLGEVAKRNGQENAVIFALPTVLMVQTGEAESQRVQITPGPYRVGDLRFDQVEGVLEIAREARAGRLSPKDGLRKLDAVWRMKHRYGDFGFVVGYLITTIGTALMLRPTWNGLGYVAILGLICALLLVVVRRQPAWNAVMPVVASFILASVVALFYRYGVCGSPVPIADSPLDHLPAGQYAHCGRGGTGLRQHRVRSVPVGGGLWPIDPLGIRPAGRFPAVGGESTPELVTIRNAWHRGWHGLAW